MHTTHPHTYTHTHSMPYTTLRSTPSGLTLTFRVQMRKAFKLSVDRMVEMGNMNTPRIVSPSCEMRNLGNGVVHPDCTLINNRK